MREHWSDCAVNNGAAMPTGPCDCGGLELADDVLEPFVVPLVPASRSSGTFIEDHRADCLLQQEHLPSDGLVVNATPAHLPNPSGVVIGGIDSAGVNLDDSRKSMVTQFEAAPLSKCVTGS